MYPRKFTNNLLGHDCYTVQEIGCAGTKNGALLSVAESKGFDVFLTIDKGLDSARPMSLLSTRNLPFRDFGRASAITLWAVSTVLR